MKEFFRALSKHPFLYGMLFASLWIIVCMEFRGMSDAIAAIMAIMVFVFAFLPFVSGFIADSMEKKEQESYERNEREKKYAEEVRYRTSVRQAKDDDAVKFYRDCVAEKILDMEKESDQERLMLYVRRNYIEGSKEELIAAFQKGKDIASGVDREARIKQLREEENNIKSKNRAYLGYSGRDKLISMCKDEIRNNEQLISECKKAIDQIENGGSTFYQKEHSWATAGGVASGLGGPVVGLATAVETQQKNASIRAGNKQLIDVISNSVGPYYSKIVNAKDNIINWQKRLDTAERCLVETDNSTDYMQYLEITVKDKKLSETGAGRVKLNIKQKEKFYIFGDTDAVVDGSIKVILKKNGVNVGEGIYVFPYCGSKYSESPEVVCTGNKIPSDYNVEFSANNLWGIEKVD